ncbi:hypothetical protein ACE6H2_024312 [Prunus campanulata]
MSSEAVYSSKMATVKETIEKLMDGEESQGRRERARELVEMAKRAVAEGGSSHQNIKQLIQEIKELICIDTN